MACMAGFCLPTCPTSLLAALKLWAYRRLGLQRLIRATGLLHLLPGRPRAMETVLSLVSLRRVWSSPPAWVPATGEPLR